MRSTHATATPCSLIPPAPRQAEGSQKGVCYVFFFVQAKLFSVPLFSQG